MIEGRVVNPATGEYLENVRITVEGTILETFSDSSGQYRLAHVPAGRAMVKAFRTGAPVATHSVEVAVGSTVQRDFTLAVLEAQGRSTEGPVKLEAFTVGASKEMGGAAIAINTQRFAPNSMTVIAADEF